MGELLHDLRFAWRTLRRRPWVSAAAVASLALGIGANTTVFTLVSAFLFPALPVRDPGRLVAIYTREGNGPHYLPNSYPNYLDYRRLNPVFEDMAAQFSFPVILGAGRDAERLLGGIVSGNYFSLLGVTPVLGRPFLPEEDRAAGASAVAVVSYGLWKRRFAGAPSLVGSQVTLDGHPFTVVGVAPEGFRGTASAAAVDVWVPAAMHQQVMSSYAGAVDARRVLFFEIIGRLKQGVGLRQAQAAMQTLARQLEQQYPDENKGRTVSLVPLQEARMSPNERGVFVMTSAFLLAVVALVLLIACVNLANLLLAATASRRREIGVRVALGATRKRLVRQLLTESLVLSLTGGILGLLLAWWATRSLWALRPPSPVPIFLDLTPNGRVLAFTIAVSLVTGLAFGLAPALRASAGDVVASLKDEAAFGSGPRRFRLRSALVVSQVCVSLVVLIAATLFVRSVQKIQTIEPGFRVDDVLVISLEPGLYGYGEDRSRALYRRVTERARELPGVRSAALAARLPMSGGTGRTVVAEGRERQGAGERAPLVQTNIVGAGYFETIGIPILQGRDFTDRDVAGAPRVAIVNETMAKRYWPKEPALGKRFQVLEHRYYCEVVGIARDSKYVSPSEPAQPFFYLPLEQQFAPAMNLHLRTRGDPAAVADVVRSEIQRLDDNVSIFDVRPLRRHLAATLWMPRLGAALLGFFGMLGLLLTVVGLYGVLASSVAQRTHEIGVRMALGARARDVLGLVMKEGLLLVVVGLALGLAAALAVTRALSRLLYGVSATDPATFAGAAAVLIVVGALASYLPAKGATRADPMVALRSE